MDLSRAHYIRGRAIASVADTAAALVIAHTGASPTNDAHRVGLVRLQVMLASAVATKLVLATASARGTPSTSLSGMPCGIQGPAESKCAIDVAWSVAPTIVSDGPPANSVGLVAWLPATVGASVEWSWPVDDPLVINGSLGGWEATGLLALQNLTGGASANLVVNVEWVEFLAKVTT